MAINLLTGLDEDQPPLFTDPNDPDAQAASMMPDDTAYTVRNGVGGSASVGKAENAAIKANNGLVTIPPAGGVAGAGAQAQTAPTSLFPPEQSKTEVRNEGKSSTTTVERVAPAVQEAAGKVTSGVEGAIAQRSETQDAIADDANAQRAVLQTVRDAAREKALRTELAQRGAEIGNIEAKEVRIKAESDAAKTIADAQKKADAAYAETQKGAFTSRWGEALAGLVVAASRRNLRKMGEDPNKSGVAKTINDFVEKDKSRKLNAYLKSDQFLTDSKALPGKAREAEARKRAEIQGELSGELKLLADRFESLKSSAEADPKVVDAHVALAREKAQQEEADGILKLTQQNLEATQTANPNVKTAIDSGKTTTTRTDVDKPASQEDGRISVGKFNFNARGSSAEQAGMRKKATATNNLDTNLGELDQLLAEGASPLTTGTRRAEIETRVGILTGKIKESEELGALDNGVERLVKSQIGDPLSMKQALIGGGAEGARAKIKIVREGAKKDLANSLITHGNDPAAVREAVLGEKPNQNFTPEERDIGGVKYRRVGPGPKDWKKVK